MLEKKPDIFSWQFFEFEPFERLIFIIQKFMNKNNDNSNKNDGDKNKNISQCN